MEYGIITVPSNWNIDRPVGFSKEDHDQWHEEIEPGCRVLIFQKAPVSAIVAEGVIPDNVFLKPGDWPSENTHSVTTLDGNNADYVIPLRIIRNYSESAHTSQSQIQEVLALDTISTQAWTPITIDHYRRLVDIPD